MSGGDLHQGCRGGMGVEETIALEKALHGNTGGLVSVRLLTALSF